MPRPRNPEIAERLIEVAARLLAEEGATAVTARRLGAEVGTSTMAVYTHFGGMDELLAGVWREGFVRFGAALDAPPHTDDPLADWIQQGWAYRRFALENRHLYRIMFGAGASSFRSPDPADNAVAAATFASLLDRVRRAADAGLLHVEDLGEAGIVVWSSVHGNVMIELGGFFDAHGGDASASYAACLRHLALGFGADSASYDRALDRVSRR